VGAIKSKTALLQYQEQHTIFLPFLKFPNSKFHLKLRIYTSEHLHQVPRSKNPSFFARESEGIEAEEGNGG
jgi:hypothetical protein